VRTTGVGLLNILQGVMATNARAGRTAMMSTDTRSFYDPLAWFVIFAATVAMVWYMRQLVAGIPNGDFDDATLGILWFKKKKKEATRKKFGRDESPSRPLNSCSPFTLLGSFRQ
jgi:hypothetical protein